MHIIVLYNLVEKQMTFRVEMLNRLKLQLFNTVYTIYECYTTTL